MWKIISVILIAVLLGLGYVWYSMQSLPQWFGESDTSQQSIDNRSASKFLGDKMAEVMNGEVTFSEEEFNRLFLASLQRSDDGRKLLEVSDGVKAFLHRDEIEISAIINLDKVEAVNPDARKAVERFDRIFPFLNGSRMALTVYGTPVVRNGSVGIKDDFHIKVGAMPFSNDTLRGLGVEVARANSTNLKLKYVTVKSMNLQDQRVTFGVLPRF